MIYTLSLWWHLTMAFAALSLSIKTLDQLIKTRLAISKQLILDQKLELCGALLSGEKNLLAAESYLATTFLEQKGLSPSQNDDHHHIQALRITTEAALTEIEERRLALGCDNFPAGSLQPTTRYCVNSRLHPYWPNWLAAYHDSKE